MKNKEFCQQYNITRMTLSKWKKDGLVDYRKLPNGRFDYIKLKDEIQQQIDDIKDWKDLNLYLKNLKVRYRVSLNDLTQSFIVFRNKSCKSKVTKLNFVYNL